MNEHATASKDAAVDELTPLNRASRSASKLRFLTEDERLETTKPPIWLERCPASLFEHLDRGFQQHRAARLFDEREQLVEEAGIGGSGGNDAEDRDCGT